MPIGFGVFIAHDGICMTTVIFYLIFVLLYIYLWIKYQFVDESNSFFNLFFNPVVWTRRAT